jgi:hypothetical protein
MLRDIDERYLEENGHRFSTHAQGAGLLLVLEEYQVPAGYEPHVVDLLIEIPSTYPDGKLDMWWVYPPVVFARTGTEPVNTQVRQPFAAFGPEPDRQWQRFSRHPEWRVGVDDLRTYLGSLRSTMQNEVRQLAS